MLVLLSFTSHWIIFAQEPLQKSKIEDESGYLTLEQKTTIGKEIQSLPEVFRIIFIPKIDSAIDVKAKELFKEKQLAEDTILILAVVEHREVYIITGEALQKKGLNDVFFQKEINQYFVPAVKIGSIDEAIIQLTKGINKDITGNLSEKDKDSPKIPEAPLQVKESSRKPLENNQWIWVGGLVFVALIVWFVNKQRKESS